MQVEEFLTEVLSACGASEWEQFGDDFETAYLEASGDNIAWVLNGMISNSLINEDDVFAGAAVRYSKLRGIDPAISSSRFPERVNRLTTQERINVLPWKEMKALLEQAGAFEDSPRQIRWNKLRTKSKKPASVDTGIGSILVAEWAQLSTVGAALADDNSDSLSETLTTFEEYGRDFTSYYNDLMKANDSREPWVVLKHIADTYEPSPFSERVTERLIGLAAGYGFNVDVTKKAGRPVEQAFNFLEGDHSFDESTVAWGTIVPKDEFFALLDATEDSPF